MALTTQELIDLAKELVVNPSEAHSRCAAGRAYYSAFHTLLPLVGQLPATNDDARRADRISHGELLRRMEEWLPSGNLACLAALKVSAGVAAKELRAARATRERADYALDTDFPDTVARQQIDRARKLRQFVMQANELLTRNAA